MWGVGECWGRDVGSGDVGSGDDGDGDAGCGCRGRGVGTPTLTPHSLLPTPYSPLPTPHSLLPTPALPHSRPGAAKSRAILIGDSCENGLVGAFDLG